MGLISRWIESQERQKLELIRRTEALNQLARPFRMTYVLEEVKNDLGLRPHSRGSLKNNAAGIIDFSYEVCSDTYTRGHGRRREPYHVAAILEGGEGEYYDLAYEKYTTHRTKWDQVLALTLTENGEFHINQPYERTVRLGTTGIIKSSDDLLIAVRDHVKRGTGKQ